LSVAIDRRPFGVCRCCGAAYSPGASLHKAFRRRPAAAVPAHSRNNAGDRRFALLPRDRSRLRAPSRRPTMNNVIYLIGLVVIVMAILSLLGLR
jgi:hypothetical protein